MTRTMLFDAINAAYLALEDEPGDFSALRKLEQDAWSLQYVDPDTRAFAMFLVLWSADVRRNFGNNAKDVPDEARKELGASIAGTLFKTFILDYDSLDGSMNRGKYTLAMELLTNLYIGAIRDANSRAACCM